MKTHYLSSIIHKTIAEKIKSPLNSKQEHDRMQQRTFKMTIFLTLKALKKNTAPQHHSTTTLLLSLLLGCCWSGDSSAVE